ncbi:MAG: ECF transporter S component [Corallococcus sp.]|nr:ECF transporter S component [Corallococcus sp.]
MKETSQQNTLRNTDELVSEQTSQVPVEAIDEGFNQSAGKRFRQAAKHAFSVNNIATISVLSAISFILYAFVKFPLPWIFPAFLDIQFSDLPALLGGFALGPVAGCLIIIVKCCLKMLFGLSSTNCVGEIADIFVGIAFVLPAALFYKYRKSKKGAIGGLAVGGTIAVGVSVLANWLILIPAFTQLFAGGDFSKIVGMVSGLYGGVNESNFYAYYLPLGVVPFNMLRCLLCAIITYFVYKPLSKVLHWEYKPRKKSAAAESASQSTQESVCAEGLLDTDGITDGESNGSNDTKEQSDK